MFYIIAKMAIAYIMEPTFIYTPIISQSLNNGPLKKKF